MQNNKDISQINKFKGFGSLPNHRWVESSNGLTPEEAYFRYTSLGEKSGLVSYLSLLNNLFLKKSARDNQKKMWTEDLLSGSLSVQELLEDDLEDLAFDCMKDIVKTTDRLQIMEKGGDHTLSFYNRNWFIDKLNLKFPEDMCSCYQCKETFWKFNKYVKL